MVGRRDYEPLNAGSTPARIAIEPLPTTMMKPDIVPYSNEDAEKIAKFLVSRRIACGGPTLSLKLKSMADAVDRLCEDVSTPLTDDMKTLLHGVRDRLLDVAKLNGFMACEVIARLQAAIDDEANKKETP